MSMLGFLLSCSAPISRIEFSNMLINLYKLRHHPADWGTTRRRVGGMAVLCFAARWSGLVMTEMTTRAGRSARPGALGRHGSLWPADPVPSVRFRTDGTGAPRA